MVQGNSNNGATPDQRVSQSNQNSQQQQQKKQQSQTQQQSTQQRSHQQIGSKRTNPSGSNTSNGGLPSDGSGGDGGGISAGPPPEKKKKRLTQACQHCRKKKIKCDGLRPSCRNCAKSNIPCTYIPSVRKRGRTGMRIPLTTPYGTTSSYDRSLASQHMALASQLVAGNNSAMNQPQTQQHIIHPQYPYQQVFSIDPAHRIQYQQQQQQQQHHHHHQRPPPPPPHNPIPPPQINPLGSQFLGGAGPASLHLKRDPGFGQDLMEEAMYDPSKQAYDMSTHFLLPVNHFQFPTYTPASTSSLGAQAGPSNRSIEKTFSSKDAIGAGTNTNIDMFGAKLNSVGSNNVGSISQFPRQAPTTVSMLHGGVPAMTTMPAGFNPSLIAKDLSSAYISVVASAPQNRVIQQPDVHPQNALQYQEKESKQQSRDISSNNSALAPYASLSQRETVAVQFPTTKASSSRGKSPNCAPASAHSSNKQLDEHISGQLHDLRKQIRNILSSVWAETECGKSAGMMGVALDENESVFVGEKDRNSHGYSEPETPLHGHEDLVFGSTDIRNDTSPSGDRSMDDHLVHIFFEYVHHQLPIIDRERFYRAYNKNKASPLLVCAICAAASVFLNRIEDERRSIYELYSKIVREQFHDACFSPSLRVIQTSLIMTLCEFRQGSLQRAWVYLSMGFRLAIAMGYHHQDMKIRTKPMESSLEIVKREECRRAFWGAFLLDRYTAIGGGKSLGINDEDIAVLLPLRDSDWSTHDTAPPLSVLEFFKPVSWKTNNKNNSASMKNPDYFTDSDTKSITRHIGNAFTESPSSSPDPSVSIGGDSNVGPSLRTSIISTSSMQRCTVSHKGSDQGSIECDDKHKENAYSDISYPDSYDNKASDLSALSHFIKLMTVVGQIAQHINSAKSNNCTKFERPDNIYKILDASLLRWKEELPPEFSYSEARSLHTGSELAVFVACMHALYYGAVIMLNRENMGLLCDLPGQFDVSTNLAIRSLERCRVAAMEVVEISHHICSLPSAMTNALLPWALFQAGTLLIHFMIAGASQQAQEEAKAAILMLDCALRDELSRYWSVSSKYHLVLSNMVRAWERTKQLTTSQLQPSYSHSNISFGINEEQNEVQAKDSNQDNSTMQTISMYIDPQTRLFDRQNITVGSHTLSQQQQQQQSHTNANHPKQQKDGSLSLLKSFNMMSHVPIANSDPKEDSNSLPHFDPIANVAQQQRSSSTQVKVHDPALPSYMFTPDAAQDSINTFNTFLSQLSPEQAVQFVEGLNTYTMQGSRGLNARVSSVENGNTIGNNFINDPVFAAVAAAVAVSSESEQLSKNGSGQLHPQQDMTNHLNQDQTQNRHGPNLISSSSDLFTAPGIPILSVSSIASTCNQSNADSNPTELDPMLFNPMTPFLQELQLLNSQHISTNSTSDSKVNYVNDTNCQSQN